MVQNQHVGMVRDVVHVQEKGKQLQKLEPKLYYF